MKNKKFDTEAVDLKNIVVGKSYPLFGMITSIVENTPERFVGIINYTMKATFNSLTETFREMVVNRVFEPGIFVCEVLAVNEKHTVGEDFQYNENTVFQLELSVETVIFNKKRTGPEGTTVEDETCVVRGNEKISFKGPVTEEDAERVIEAALRRTYDPKPGSAAAPPLNYEQKIEGSLNLVNKLKVEFATLRSVIANAKGTLAAKPNCPPDVLDRLNSYTEMVGKQEAMIPELEQAIKQGNAEGTALFVQKINGLSNFIREDARDILAGKRFAKDFNEEEIQ